MNRKKSICRIFAACLYFIGGALTAGMYWAHRQFGKVDFSTVIFHLKQPLEGAQVSPFTQGIRLALIVGVICVLIAFLLAYGSARLADRTMTVCAHTFHLQFGFFERHFLLFGLVCVFLGVGAVACEFDVPSYVLGSMQEAKLYEDYYVEPRDVTVTFPEKKRNLIYIYMESMETTYMSCEENGNTSENLIPEMTQLAYENTNFAVSGNTNGAISAYGTDWTFASLMAQTCGIPCAMSISDSNTVEDYSTTFSGAYSLGQFLEEQGYRQVFLMGSPGSFAGRDSFFVHHGGYEIKDYSYAMANGWIEQGYWEWWGYEDQKLYEFAKKELLELGASDQPFNLTMLTADTHFVGGYTCELCDDTYENAYSNVISCASRQVYAFVEWVQKQDFYDNTTIIICGDHPTMDGAYISEIKEDALEDGSVRKVYTTVINSAVDYAFGYDRTFTTMDMYPTTLASIGAVIDGDRLGLGTNLYSRKPTLAEQLGMDTLNSELRKSSEYYKENILVEDVLDEGDATEAAPEEDDSAED